MQHSQLRRPNEPVKLFAKNPSNSNLSLVVYEFSNGGLVDITPNYTVNNLNPAYFSTEIITPDHNCYLLIMFCGNPIVLRVGQPSLEFFYWSKKQKTYGFKHFDEFGTQLAEGLLNPLGQGFYYTTPVSDVLGYIEVGGTPYVIHVPYCSGSVGVGIDIDWRRVIKRQSFGLTTTKLNFKLNTNKLEFVLNSNRISFSMKVKKFKHGLKKIKQNFKVSCKG
jgi:hypothetical protein